jgi:uncharacterized protein with NAD-binding domain and iron-sulfur cluster
VAILGGGCAAMTAAFELTRPGHRGHYEVTVYQQGWRLGGKGASGRGPAGRVEEHGLHVWMGFYENAFRILRECYAELGRDPACCRIATWQDAFLPASSVGLAEQDGGGLWSSWTASFPAMPGLPGDPLAANNPFTVSGYLLRAARLLLALFESVREPARAAADPAGGAPWSLSPEALFAGLSRLVRYGSLATAAGVLEGLRSIQALFEVWSRTPPQRGAEGPLDVLVDALSRTALRVLRELTGKDPELRRTWIIADLLLTVIRGSVRFGLVTDPRGFDAIDDYDYRDWLEINGASRETIDSSFVRALGYNLSFSYEDGDLDRPRTSAGQALRGALRMFFTYRGSLFWKMSAGMGDIVFAPLYEVLKRRGVRFELFHRLENVKLADPARLAPGEKPYVEALDFDVQARVRGGGEYLPLVDVRGLPCWPSRPDFSQLEDGGRLEAEGWDFESFWDLRKAETRTLRVGEDFDCVILGVGIGAVPHVCREIVARDPRWRRMVENVRSVDTQAFQLWMKADAAGLGWRGPDGVTLSGFVEPFDTWADMTHLLAVEDWPAGREPRSLAYFCSVLPTPNAAPDRADRGYPSVRRDGVRRTAIGFLERDVRHLWPGAADPGGGFRWDLLATGDGPGATGAARFDSQFWTANVNPSDRYTLTLPGSAKSRISPLDNTYDNLTIAGDWTACGFLGGCVEAAVMSGRLAAHAVAGTPALEEIVGFDHP